MRIDTIDNKAFGTKTPTTEIKDTGLDLSTNDSPLSLSSPFRNPYGNTSSNRTTNTSSTKGLTAAERNNNPFNIKFGKFAAKYGATKENRNALDGGNFATFPTVDAGFKAAKDLLQSNGYRNLTVDAAMKRWSNSGYGGNIYPEIANKRISDLNASELDNLQKKQIVREDRNYAKKLGIYKYGGYLPKMQIGGLTPQPYTTTANPLSTGLNKYTSQTALNNLIKDNTKKSTYTPPSVESTLNTGMLTTGLGVAGAALSTLDDNPRKVNQPINIGSGILKGAAAGATVGSFFPGAGTAIGAVAGAAVGGVTSYIKGKKRQKLIDQSIENDQKNFNTIQQDRSRALYAQLNPYTYKFGGNIKPEWEAEKDEVIQGNPILEESKQIANGLHLVGGKTHENGGTKGAGEGRVFSNSIFFNGKTPATMVKNIGSKLKKFEPNLSSKDSMKRTTAEVMTKKLNDQIEEVFERQESFKQTPQFRFGGNLPKFAEGGDTVAAKKKQIQDRIKTLDRYLSENTKRQALGGFDAKDKLRAERNQLQKQLDNPAIWTGKPFDPFAKTGNGKLPVKDIAWENDLNAVTVKGKREIPTNNSSARKTALPKIATRNNINLNSGIKTGRTNLVQNPNNPLARINREVAPIAPVENNRSVATNSPRTRSRLNIDPALVTGLGLSAAGYLNTAANINRMNTDVPVNLTASPYYGYTDRSRLARHDLAAMGNTILRDPNVSSGRKQAIFARLSQGVNQINAQENSNRYAYDNEFNTRQLEINTRNNAMLTQAQQQKIANQNAILGARSANFNSFMGNVTGVIAENEQRKLDERKMKIITDSYRRNYGTDFNVTANP